LGIDSELGHAEVLLIAAHLDTLTALPHPVGVGALRGESGESCERREERGHGRESREQ